MGISSDGHFNPAIGPGEYAINYIYSANSCSDSAITMVSINPPPQLDFISNTTIGCAPLSVELKYTGEPFIKNCSWDIGNNKMSNNCDTITTLFEDFGCYDIKLTAENEMGCKNTKQIENMICVEPSPTASFNWEPNPIYMSNPKVNFSSNGSISSLYEWSFGGLAYSNVKNPTFPFHNVNGRYEVCLKITEFDGCSDSLCNEIEILDEFLVFIPSAFTPNGNGINDQFCPIFNGVDDDGFNIKIFNRWGQIVFQSKDVKSKWNGQEFNKGQITKQELYNWVITCVEKSNKKIHHFKGSIFMSK